MTDRIANAGNTLIPAYLALQTKGYRVWWERSGSAPDDETWFAEGPLGKFIADDTLQLLGLITMREVRGESWQASDDQIDEFMKRYEV